MSDENGSLGTNLMLFLVGAAAGAALVALTTPKTGSDLRADIKDLAGRLKTKLHEAGFDIAPAGGREGANDQEG